MTHETGCGTQPFEKMTRAEFELRGLKNSKHAAYLQYKLMLLEPVLRAHVDFANKRISIDYLDPAKSTKAILDSLKPVRATLKDKRVVDYDRLMGEGFHESGFSKGSR